MPAITKNPARQSVNRLREMISSSGAPLFTCSLTKRPVPARAHGRSSVDNDGSILLFVDRNMIQPGHETHLAQLFYANGNDMEFLSVSGTGEQVLDNELVREHRRRQTDDTAILPDDLLLRIRPETVYSWNTRTGALTPMISQ